MLPKTYLVHLNRPLGASTHHPYIFYLHTQNHNEALRWVDRVFEGISIYETLRRWTNTALVPHIGNSDPVVISDCDLFRSPERKSEQFVFERLQDVCENLQDEVKQFTSSFHSMYNNYMKRPIAWEYDRMAELKKYAELAERWHRNLSQELINNPLQKTLTMPPVLHEQAA